MTAARLTIPGAVLAGLIAFWAGLIVLSFLDYPRTGIAIYDDAFFFTRYAEIFLQTGRFAFNAGEAPTYGNTSQLYQALVTLVYWLTGRDPVATLLACSLAGSSAALAALIGVYRLASGEARWRELIVCLLAGHLILSINFQFLALSGMETSWTIAAVAMALRSLLVMARAPTARAAMAAGLWQISVFLARPDASVVALAPLAALCLMGSPAIRTQAWRASLIAAAGIVACLAAAWHYYGDALPLAVFIKAVPISSLTDWDGHTHEGGPPLVSFLRGYGSLIALAPLWCVHAWRRRGDQALVLGAGLLAGIVFVCLQWALVIQVMGMWGRFYAPALAVLVVPGLLGLEIFLDWWRRSLPKILPALLMAAVVLAFALPAAKRLYLRLGTALVEIALLAENGIPAWNAKAQMEERLDENVGLKPKLIAALENNPRCSIASSEDGLLASYFTQHRIVDLSALHDRDQAHGGFSAERLLMLRQPQVLIFPDPWYAAWIAQINAHPALARDYKIVGTLRAGEMPVAVRRDGPCLAPIEAAFAKP